MFAIVGNILACIAWGILLAVIFVGMLYLLMKAIHTRYSLTVPVGLVLLLLFVLFSVQSSMLVGTLYAKGLARDVRELAVDILNSVSGSSQEIQLAELKAEITEQLPMAGSFLEMVDVTELCQTGQNVALLAIKKVEDEITAYMWRRILWLAVFAVGGCVVLSFMKPPQRTSRRVAINWEE